MTGVDRDHRRSDAVNTHAIGPSKRWSSGHVAGVARFVVGTTLALALAAGPASADEGGASVYVPGFFASLAAVPGAPGWSLGAFYYHTSADASASKEFRVGGSIVAGLDARADLAFFAPAYTFAQPVLGGQAAVLVLGGFGRMRVSTTATLTGPRGREVALGRSDAITGGTDLYPTGTLKWQRGVHNFMTYGMIGIPTGAYDVNRLANISTHHWSIDAGGGYTYFDPSKRREFSVVAGLTYNFENPATDYRNGVDGHVEWAASHFFSEQLHAGVAGYFYRQLSGDSGPGAVLGDFKSRTNGIGPQVGYFFPVGGGKGYVNLKGYWEFDAAHRPEGWNAWLTLGLPL
ncbi:MAG: transporter [Acidobacteriota bacterium]